MTFQEFKQTYSRNPWAKLKYYEPGSWFTRGGWKTIRGAERELKSQQEYDVAMRAVKELPAILAQLVPKVPTDKLIKGVIE